MSIKRFYISKSQDCFCFHYYIRHRGAKILLKYGFTRDLCSGIIDSLQKARKNLFLIDGWYYPSLSLQENTFLTTTKTAPGFS